MIRQLGVVLAASLFAVNANATEFDCTKASSKVEKMICEDDDLPQLDANLNDKYNLDLSELSNRRFIKENLEVKKELIKSQKHWLKDVRNTCQNIECLKQAYKDRIEEIDPLADKKITCEKMRRYPKQIFVKDIDLGSGSVSPTEVDYDCPESLNSLNFLGALSGLADVIHGPVDRCMGTMVIAEERYYAFSLLEAGIAPDIFLRSHDALNVSRESIYSKYLKNWAKLSFYNWELYTQFMTEMQDALPKLALRYRQKFGLTKNKSDEAAHLALDLFLHRAAGGVSSYTTAEGPLPKLFEVVSDPKSTESDLKATLKTMPKDVNSQSMAYSALKIALLNEKPRLYLGLLVDFMGGSIDDALNEAGPHDINAGDSGESAIFFAIRSHDDIQFLLEHGANANYENSFGKTPLFYAIGFNDHKLATMLIQKGADVNHPYKSAQELYPQTDDYCRSSKTLEHTHRTPLMHAAQNSDVEMMKLLIKSGARLRDLDEMGFNAADYALMGGSEVNSEFLDVLGLKPNKHAYTKPSQEEKDWFNARH